MPTYLIFKLQITSPMGIAHADYLKQAVESLNKEFGCSLTVAPVDWSIDFDYRDSCDDNDFGTSCLDPEAVAKFLTEQGYEGNLTYNSSYADSSDYDWSDFRDDTEKLDNYYEFGPGITDPQRLYKAKVAADKAQRRVDMLQSWKYLYLQGCELWDVPPLPIRERAATKLLSSLWFINPPLTFDDLRAALVEEG